MSITLDTPQPRADVAFDSTYLTSLKKGQYPDIPTLQSSAAFAQEVITRRKPRAFTVTAHTAAIAHALGWRMAMAQRERELLTTSAWLHGIGIGIAPSPSPHGWLGIIGAMTVREMGFTPVANLIAWSGTSPEEAQQLGLMDVLAEFPSPDPRLVSALTYAITHTDPVAAVTCSLPNRLVSLRSARGASAMSVTAMEQAWGRLHTVEGSVLADIAVGPRVIEV